MGTLKDEMLQNGSEDIRQHHLTDGEMAYLKLLTLTLQYHTMAQRIMSGFLYYVAVNRLGYNDSPTTALQFEIDPTKDNVLTIKVLPDQAVHSSPLAAMPVPPPEQPPAPPAV